MSQETPSSYIPNIITPPTTAITQDVPRRILPKAGAGYGRIKAKHGKSRDGCVTCKAKRRKCDEMKPACSQCLRRRVTCGGYGKELIFKEFSKPEPPRRVTRDTERHLHHGPANDALTEKQSDNTLSEPGVSQFNTAEVLEPRACRQDMHSLQPPPSANTPLNLSFSPSAQAVDFDMLLPDIESLEYSQSYYYSGTDSREAAGNEVPAVSPNILNPEPETEHFVATPISLSHILGCDDDSWACSLNTTVAPHVQSDGHGPFSFHWHPIVGDNSPESIALIFDNRVCEVLCIKESSTGNPWRKIVWPLARKHDALYHAVAAMTCFHGSNRLPQLRGEGMRHLECGMKKLSAEGHSEMPLEVALAVTLALSIAKTWYHPRASNGIDYINNAKDLLQEAVSRNLASKPLEGDLSLVFLANTWLYMDVLTRITCQNIQVADFSPLSACVPKGHGADSSHQVDPLMGCAETLFPLIGRVADLVRRVRLTRSRLNSPAVVSLAVELKMSIASWVPSVNSEVSFDEGDPLTSDASDLVQTANAYKWATLLLLYQAVPELPGHLSFSELAQKVLVLIATVPLNSRATIFPIFPLMVAGCETTEAEDRDWVRHRWQSVADGNSSGIVERCLELTLEVWRRRDALKRPPLPLASALVTRDGGLGMGDGCGESTVKSKSHWLSVMEEWGWEVMLG